MTNYNDDYVLQAEHGDLVTVADQVNTQFGDEIREQVDNLKEAYNPFKGVVGKTSIVGHMTPGDGTLYNVMMVIYPETYGDRVVMFSGSLTKVGGPILLTESTGITGFHAKLDYPNVWTTAVYWIAARYFGGFRGAAGG